MSNELNALTERVAELERTVAGLQARFWRGPPAG